MKRVVIRHGKPIFGHFLEQQRMGPPLSDSAVYEAKMLGARLRRDWAARYDALALDKIAVSDMLRAQQTAIALGARILPSYKELREVKLSEAEEANIEISNTVPETAIRAGEQLALNPPEEQVMVSHGLRISGLLAYLGVEVERFFPDYLDYHELDF